MTSQSSTPRRLLKIAQVIEETSLSRRSIYRLIAQGEFPPSRKISPQRVAWRADEVEAWMQARPINFGGLSGGLAKSE